MADSTLVSGTQRKQYQQPRNLGRISVKFEVDGVGLETPRGLAPSPPLSTECEEVPRQKTATPLLPLGEEFAQ